MKIHANVRELGRARFGMVIAGLAASLLAALPAFGLGDFGHPTGSGPGGGLAAGGDETVGTLPMIGGGRRIDLPLVRHWRGTSPAFSLEGQPGDILLAIRGARGRGFVSHEVLDPLTGRIRLAFHGDVLVALDRAAAEGLPIDFGIAVPEAFGEGRIAFRLGAAPALVSDLLPGTFPVPLASLSETNALDGTQLRIRTAGETGIRSSHALTATAETLVLVQRD